MNQENLNTSSWWEHPAAPLDQQARAAAEQRQTQLTKPPGALGRLEQIAINLAAMQSTEKPMLEPEKIHITVFAADHGVAEENVSAFPQAVTAEMVRNFSRGDAAISVLARNLDATLAVRNLGTVDELEPLENVQDLRIAPGTKNFTQKPAMNETEVFQALEAGKVSAEVAHQQGCPLYIGGEMGIANTTSAAAIAAALFGKPGSEMAGAGTGLDSAGIQHKGAVIDRALALHAGQLCDPLAVLRCLGGLEIAALVGAYLRAAQLGMPVLVDGFITTTAALVAIRLQPDALNWMLFSHRSAEAGHRMMLDALEVKPLLDLGMRLGEGSGAAVAVPLLQQACQLHAEMATFAEASISEAV